MRTELVLLDNEEDYLCAARSGRTSLMLLAQIALDYDVHCDNPECPCHTIAEEAYGTFGREVNNRYRGNEYLRMIRSRQFPIKSLLLGLNHVRVVDLRVETFNRVVFRFANFQLGDCVRLLEYRAGGDDQFKRLAALLHGYNPQLCRDAWEVIHQYTHDEQYQ